MPVCTAQKDTLYKVSAQKAFVQWIAVWGKQYYGPHFLYKDTEDQMVYIIN